MLLNAGVFLAACGSVGTARGQSRFEFQRLCMGVPARVVVYADSENHATSAARVAFARLAELDQIMSDYRPSSELMRLCGSAGHGRVNVSKDLFRVLQSGASVHDATNGAFDASVGSLSRLWREARKSGALPSRQAIAEAPVGWEHVHLSPRSRTVELDHPIIVDLGGIAKGYAAMEAVRTLRSRGLPCSMVAIAGDIATGEAPPGEPGWRINIDPGAENAQPISVDICNQNASTSGDHYQFLEVNGVRYSHILDPRTGMGVTRRAAACVIADDGAIADACATALCVSPELAAPLAERFRVRVFLWQPQDTHTP